MTQRFPTDNDAYRFPVSVKAVVFHGNEVLLLHNERDEWELPGGKLEPMEEPVDTVVREVREELGIEVQPGPLLDSWVYHIANGVAVLILTFGCHGTKFEQMAVSHEHKALGRFAMSEIAALNMPAGYKRSIATWHGMLVKQS
jgi:8-oxo-dGTP pyrophosphatase MutT (NUDIX family)